MSEPLAEHLPPLLTVQGAAQFLSMSPKAIRRAIANGSLPSIKVGRARSSPVRVVRDEMLARFGLLPTSELGRRRRAANTEYARCMAGLSGDGPT